MILMLFDLFGSIKLITLGAAEAVREAPVISQENSETKEQTPCFLPPMAVMRNKGRVSLSRKSWIGV